MNEGAIKCFQGLACSKTMTTIYISDCQWEATEDMMAAIKHCMTTNTTLAKYDLKHNAMEDAGIEELTTILGTCKHVTMIMLSEWLMSEAMTKLQDAILANKPAKGKKKGKKK